MQTLTTLNLAVNQSGLEGVQTVITALEHNRVIFRFLHSNIHSLFYIDTHLTEFMVELY
jgi:hypothetical protein